ncbi:MAG TPA: hypothetical protein VKP59_07385 [Candidatus Thermoplasmatota archaeon]|nr:hypothetical protein [Candidatus Thermoplasmatota archaeon]
MNRKIFSGLIVTLLLLSSIGISAYTIQDSEDDNQKDVTDIQKMTVSENYEIQWQKNYGSDWSGGRFQGPQPIGDCDNDGENELLIAGRDGKIDVMKWNENKQTYESTAVLHSPFYSLFLLREFIAEQFFDEYVTPPDAGGFAIGDITGDGKNEIAATWYGAVYKYIGGNYRLIGLNSWIFRNDGGNGDCYIGDCDNDGQNELIMSGGGGSREQPVPEIVILKWNGYRLEKVASYDNPGYGYAFMAGVGDPDDDGENEIAVGMTTYENGANEFNRLLVLDWNKQTNMFEETVLYKTKGWDGAPFGGWCADSDQDGIDEIHMGYVSPRISIFDWNGEEYCLRYDMNWSGEGMLIEGMNVGDIDYDDVPEVCVGTDKVHILQWNGSTYVEEAVITETYGDLAVLNIGDCDNDGQNEMNVAPVFVDRGEDYISWVIQHK